MKKTAEPSDISKIMSSFGVKPKKKAAPLIKFKKPNTANGEIASNILSSTTTKEHVQINENLGHDSASLLANSAGTSNPTFTSVTSYQSQPQSKSNSLNSTKGRYPKLDEEAFPSLGGPSSSTVIPLAKPRLNPGRGILMNNLVTDSTAWSKVAMKNKKK